MRDELEILFSSKIEETLRYTLEPQALPTFVTPGPVGSEAQQAAS